MHSGRTVGWTGRIEHPVGQRPGRHRKATSPEHALDTDAAAPTPRAATTRLVTDPLTDTTPAGGLHKFDLGMVPASVTPPRTWRRAAWFAVASSAAALGGLLLATSALVGNSTSVRGLELPSMPRGRDFPSLPGKDRYHLTGDPTRPEGIAGPTVHESRLASPPGTAARRPGAVGGVVPVDRPGLPTRTGSGPAGTTRPPTREPLRLLRLSDTEAIQQRSDQYFAAICGSDLRSAYALTTGALRDEGFEAFASRYAGAMSIEVTEVSVNSGRTITTLRMTRADGSVLTQRRALRFTTGDHPMIDADELVS
jgi:hypothetical protein